MKNVDGQKEYSKADIPKDACMSLCALVEETKLNRKELLQNQIWALKFMTALPEINWRENTFQDY